MSHFKTHLKLLSGVLLTAGLVTPSAWGQTAVAGDPAVAASAPMVTAQPANRAEVKADAKAAQRDGQIPQGEAGTTKDHPKGGALAVGPNTKKGENSRAEIKADAKRARAAGDVPTGEGDVSKDRPTGGPKITKGSDTTRAAVKAETKRAEKAGEIPKGEASVPAKTL